MELLHGHAVAGSVVAADIGHDRAGFYVEDLGEAVPSDVVDKVGNARVVEHRGVYGEETKPALADFFRDGRAQPLEVGEVSDRADEEHPHHHCGMNAGAAKV